MGAIKEMAIQTLMALYGRRITLQKVTLYWCVVALVGGGLLGAEATVASEEGAGMHLANENISIEFDAANGAVASMKNRSLNVDYTVGAPSASLFVLQYLDGKSRSPENLAPQSGSMDEPRLDEGRRPADARAGLPCALAAGRRRARPMPGLVGGREQ